MVDSGFAEGGAVLSRHFGLRFEAAIHMADDASFAAEIRAKSGPISPPTLYFCAAGAASISFLRGFRLRDSSHAKSLWPSRVLRRFRLVIHSSVVIYLAE